MSASMTSISMKVGVALLLVFSCACSEDPGSEPGGAAVNDEGGDPGRAVSGDLGSDPGEALPEDEGEDPGPDTVDELICCLLEGRAEEMLGSLCANAGGEPHEVDLCKVACCGEALMTELECSRRGLSPRPDVTYCDRVCCSLLGGYTTKKKGSCFDAGGSNAGGPVLCETVCCRDASDYSPRPRAECLLVGKEAQAAADCDFVCCAHGDSYTPGTRGACTNILGGKSAGGVDQCEAACCTDGFSFKTMAMAECKAPWTDHGDSTACDQVCCLAGEAYKPVTKGVCLEILEGSVTGGPEQCEQVCCTDGSSFVTAYRAQCEPPRVEALDTSLCEEICCYPTGDGGSAEVSRGPCLNLLEGEEGGEPKSCRDGCCHGAEGYETKLKAGCKAPEEELVEDTTKCEQLCCAMGDDKYLPRTKGTCLEVDGGEIAGETAVCEPVCCKEGIWGYSRVAKAACAEPFEIEEDEPSLYEEKCCTWDSDSQYDRATKGTCLHVHEGTVRGEAESCETICCDDVSGYFSTARVLCDDPHGRIEEDDPGLCDQVCCLVGGKYESPVSKGDCLLDLEGEVFGTPEDCATTCGDGVCEVEFGEDSESCPEECGCAAGRSSPAAVSKLCNNRAADFRTGQIENHPGPAPGGCWCDEACQWREQGCCADKVEVCGPKCGDGVCQVGESALSCLHEDTDEAGSYECPSWFCGQWGPKWMNRETCNLNEDAQNCPTDCRSE